MWGFAGALLGTLYAGVFGVLLHLPPAAALLAATAGAGAVTAAFYAAIQMALVGTLAGALASIIGTLILYTHPERLLPLLLIAGLAGALAGVASVWLIGGTTAGTLPEERVAAIGEVLRRLPAGSLGGALGGALTGALLELSGVAWQTETD